MYQDNKGYKKLNVWREGHILVKMIYEVTKKFPKEEMFGLTSQLRRAAVSVVANMVEGQARSYKKEFAQFLSMANGSLVEVEYYLELAKDLNYLSLEEYENLETQKQKVARLLIGLIRSKKS